MKPTATWRSSVTCIDVDTGEELTQEYARKHYALIKTKKELTYVGKYKNARILKITKLYRNRQQLNLF